MQRHYYMTYSTIVITIIQEASSLTDEKKGPNNDRKRAWIEHQIVVENNTYNGNDLHDLESIVTIWKALGMFKK